MTEMPLASGGRDAGSALISVGSAVLAFLAGCSSSSSFCARGRLLEKRVSVKETFVFCRIFWRSLSNFSLPCSGSNGGKRLANSPASLSRWVRPIKPAECNTKKATTGSNGESGSGSLLRPLGGGSSASSVVSSSTTGSSSLPNFHKLCKTRILVTSPRGCLAKLGFSNGLRTFWTAASARGTVVVSHTSHGGRSNRSRTVGSGGNVCFKNSSEKADGTSPARRCPPKDSGCGWRRRNCVLGIILGVAAPTPLAINAAVEAATRT